MQGPDDQSNLFTWLAGGGGIALLTTFGTWLRRGTLRHEEYIRRLDLIHDETQEIKNQVATLNTRVTVLEDRDARTG